MNAFPKVDTTGGFVVGGIPLSTGLGVGDWALKEYIIHENLRYSLP